MSRVTIDKPFFDQLWPLILDENICDTHSTNTSPFFVPKRPLDELWMHSFLSMKNFGDKYEKPIHFHCEPCAEEEHEDEEESERSPTRRTLILEDEEQEYASLCQAAKAMKIVPLDKQLKALEKAEEQRKQLASDFANRLQPWYLPRPSYEFQLTDDLLNLFVNPIDRDLLRSIQTFDCRLLIINVGPYVCLHQLEHWMKFCKFVKILLIVRNENCAKRLSILNNAVLTMVFQDDLENTWQTELTRALNNAVDFAKKFKLLQHCKAAFVYIFSSRVDLNCLDKFKVLKKNV